MENEEKLKFIYIVVSFPPEGKQVGIRTLEISKRILKKNVFPIILTQKVKRNMVLNTSLLKEIPSSLKIYRTFFFESIDRFRFFLFFTIFRLAFYLRWMPFLFLKIKRILRKNNDVKFIYASGPFFYTHIVGFLLKKKYNRPLVLEYRDPWSFHPYHEESKNWLLKKIDFSIEKRILKSADLIITVSPALIDFLKKRFTFMKNKPMYSIASGITIDNTLKYKKKDSRRITFTYTGTLYKKRSIVPLLKIISGLKKEKFFDNLDFKIKIYGKQLTIDLKKVIKNLNLEDIVFLGGFVTRSKAIYEITRSDLAIHVGENLNYPTIAFKVWDYLSCRKKILYLGRDDSYTAEFLKKYDLAFIIPINKMEKGKKILINLINDLIENKINTTLDENMLKEFTWDKRAHEFVNKVLNSIR